LKTSIGTGMNYFCDRAERLSVIGGKNIEKDNGEIPLLEGILLQLCGQSR
jgi:hypothetical protein